ncbi:MAG: prolipoprotein diacylglyceryl transferase family protein [Actinomycetota bacterium]
MTPVEEGPDLIPYHTFPSFHVGPVTLHTFGLLVALGLVVGSWIFLLHGRRNGLDVDALARLAWWIVLGGIIGSRLAFVVSHPSQFADRPLAVFALWEGGLEFSGAFLLAVAIVLWWLRRHREVAGLVLTDGVVLGLAVGLAIGRIGCYSVGEHFGHETSFFLAVHYLGGATREGPIPIDAHIHNTALYEILLLLPLIALLFQMRRRGVRSGRLTSAFLLWYGIQRFATDFLRAYDRRVLGLTGAQYLCIGLVVAGLVMAARFRRVVPAEPSSPSPG